MKRTLLFLMVIVMSGFLFTACNKAEKQEESYTYQQITSTQAKELMDAEENYIILDVRADEEYQSGHIEGALLLPDTMVAEKAEEYLPDKTQLILVYCRSGRRSKLAASTLASMGYTNVKEFGGIIDWPYEIVK